MARIFRFNQQAAFNLTMQAAQQAGLPVNMPQIQQGIGQLLGKLAEMGIGLSVDDASPYFQSLMANYGNNGASHNVRQIAPQPQQQMQPVYQQPQQPMFVPQQPMQPQYPQQPTQPQYVPQAQQQVVRPAGIMPGQPLPELLPPPHMRAGMPGGGITQMPGGRVQVQAPLMQQGLGDNPAGMTNPVPPAPTILD